jgi:PAS domain S-box-containing protein
MEETPDIDRVRARAFDLTTDLAEVVEPDEDRIVEVNDAFLRVSGYGRDELVGKRPEDLGLWVDPELVRRVLEALRLGREVVGAVVQLRTKDGSIRVLRGSAVLVESDGTEYVLALGEDISGDVVRTDEIRHSRRPGRELTADERRLSARVDLALGEERARIAHQLHQSTLQDLAVATLRLYLLEKNIGSSIRADTERLGEALSAAITSTREMITDLGRPNATTPPGDESTDRVPDPDVAREARPDDEE